MSQQSLFEPCFSSLSAVSLLCFLCLVESPYTQADFLAWFQRFLSVVGVPGCGCCCWSLRCSQHSLGTASSPCPGPAGWALPGVLSLLSGLLPPSCCSWGQSWPLLCPAILRDWLLKKRQGRCQMILGGFSQRQPLSEKAPSILGLYLCSKQAARKYSLYSVQPSWPKDSKSTVSEV